jgi:hypothetical protein
LRYLNIVHLSDLHLYRSGAERFDQSQIIEALGRDLRILSEGSLKPDLIVFSGDLARSADDSVYSEIGDVISRLAEAASLSSSDVIVLPGNHDAHRLVVSAHRPLVEAVRGSCTSATTANSLYFDQGLISYVGKAFKDFHTLSRGFGPTPSIANSFVSVFLYPRLRVAVIALNTAILTNAGLPEIQPDRGRLVFPEAALVEALRGVPEGFVRIVTGHHPIDFLNEHSSGALRSALLKEADLYLFGHMHVANPENVQSPVGQCALVQSGALYASRDWWNGYCVISTVVGHPHHRLHLRRWHDARREFGVASELDDQGIIYLSPEAKAFWANVEPRLDLKSLDAWRISKLQPTVIGECNQTLTKQSLNDVFVEPEFERDVYVDTPDGRELRNKPETLTLNEVVVSGENYIIAAREESGKTALIRHWASVLAATSALSPRWSIPAIIDFDQMKSYAGGIESAVKRRLAELPDNVTPKSLLDRGFVTIFVDDMRLEESPQKDALSKFIEKFPHCRYVFLTSTPLLQGAGITPVLASSVDFSSIRIKRLKNSQLLSLIEKHGTTDPKQADKLLQKMRLEANALSVPITPVSGTFFIQIYTEDASKPLVNRANLVERYVEISLEKFASDEFLAGTFDFHNKADLLSDVAERMCRGDVYQPAEAVLLTWIREYLDNFGLRHSEVDLLVYFNEARILERCDGLVSFRLRAFMEYFAARRMYSDRSFREFVLDPTRYLSFPNEIAFYAAISRRDRDWLEELFNRFSKTSANVWASSPKEVREATLIENFSVPPPDASRAEVLAVERRILDAELTATGRQELLKSEANDHLPDHKLVYRPSLKDPGDEWIGQLTLLSAMLKNMELIPNPVKTRVLEAVIHGWLQFVSLSLGVVPALSTERKMVLSGVKYEVHFPEDMEIGEIARRLFIYMPSAVMKVAHDYMSTEKLQLQLEEGLGSPLERLSGGQQFMRVGLLALMGADDVASKLRAVGEALRGKKYLSEVLLRHIYELAVRYRLPEHELKAVRALAAELGTRLEDTPAKEIGKRKSQIIGNLAKSRLVVGIDPDTRDQVERLTPR